MFIKNIVLIVLYNTDARQSRTVYNAMPCEQFRRCHHATLVNKFGFSDAKILTKYKNLNMVSDSS